MLKQTHTHDVTVTVNESEQQNSFDSDDFHNPILTPAAPLQVIIEEEGMSQLLPVSETHDSGLCMLYNIYDDDTIQTVLNGIVSNKGIVIDDAGRVWDEIQQVRCNYPSVEEVFEHAHVPYVSPTLSLNAGGENKQDPAALCQWVIDLIKRTRLTEDNKKN